MFKLIEVDDKTLSMIIVINKCEVFKNLETYNNEKGAEVQR